MSESWSRRVPVNSRLIGYLCFGLILLALGPVARTMVVQQTAPIVRTALPPIAGCVSLQGWTADWSPTFVDPDYSIADSYQCAGYRLHVSVVQYVDQHQGKEAVGEFNSVIPRAWWNLTTRSRQSFDSGLYVDEYRVERSPMRLTIWNWYAVGVQPTRSEFSTKAMEAINALRLRASATSNLTLAVEAAPGLDATADLKNDASAIWTWFKSEMKSV